MTQTWISHTPLSLVITFGTIPCVHYLHLRILRKFFFFFFNMPLDIGHQRFCVQSWLAHLLFFCLENSICDKADFRLDSSRSYWSQTIPIHSFLLHAGREDMNLTLIRISHQETIVSSLGRNDLKTSLVDWCPLYYGRSHWWDRLI